MADAASIRAELQEGLNGKTIGLNATVKFDFDGTGIAYLDDSAGGVGAVVSDEDKDANCTLTMSVDTWEEMKAGSLDGTSAFMQGKLKVSGDMSVAMKLGQVFESVK
tara:strand:+ start:964 stop:1284 length:321 start_codon:yes stop_codon:yes gene_type:complete